MPGGIAWLYPLITDGLRERLAREAVEADALADVLDERGQQLA